MPCMAEVLTEVFTGGLELCLKVKEEQIERIFQMITRLDQDGIPELTITLQAMAKVCVVIVCASVCVAECCSS